MRDYVEKRIILMTELSKTLEEIKDNLESKINVYQQEIQRLNKK